MNSRSTMVRTENEAAGFPYIYNGVSQKVAFDTSTQSTAVAKSTSLVRVVATQDCHLATGANPTAVADGTCRFLPKGVVEYIGVNPGDKIAAIKDSSAGNLFMTEGA